MNIMKAVRQRLNLRQVEMAVIAGVTQATVSRWEKGQWEPNRDELARIRNHAISNGSSWKDAYFFNAAEPARINPRDELMKVFISVPRGKLAGHLGITPQAISQWERVPVMHVLRVEQITGVPRHELRPDIYPPPNSPAGGR